MTLTFIWIEGLIDLGLCLMDLGLTDLGCSLEGGVGVLHGS